MSAITNRLFLGSLAEANSPDWLAKNGISLVINVAVELDQLTVPPNVKHLEIPLVDSIDQNIEHVLDNLADYIHDQHIHKRETIFIHCAAGISRSATIVIYYLMKYYGHTLNTALMHVRSCRQQVNPNPHFMNTLIAKNNYMYPSNRKNLVNIYNYSLRN